MSPSTEYLGDQWYACSYHSARYCYWRHFSLFLLTSHAPRGAQYCADCTYYFRTYLSFVYFLILRFMTYVFLHLAATLCTPLAYYLAYPHVSLFPPSVKILYYSSCLSLLPMFLCCPTYANGVLVLFFNLNLIFSSFITRYLERRI